MSNQVKNTPSAGRAATGADQSGPDGLNVAVAIGAVTGQVTVRELAGGDVVTQFDLTMRTAGRKRSIPVSWPGGHVADLPDGASLLVVGVIERRFFRAGGATQSRTESQATTVVPLRRKRGVERAVDPVLDALTALVPSR